MLAHADPPARRFGVRLVLTASALVVALLLTLAASAYAGPSPVLLRTAGEFAVLGGSGLTNTGPSTIVGDVGSSPTHDETGFTPCPGAVDCVSLTGANHNVADPNDAVTQQAKTDLIRAYDDAFGRTGGTAVTAPLGGGQRLVSGVYTSAVDLFVGGDLILDAQGDDNAVFIFQAKTGTLITAAGITSGVPNTRVLLRNGAQACNVFWQVGSSATIDTFTQFVGTILALQSTTVNTSATIDAGRALSRNGAVTLDTNTIKKATCRSSSGGGSTTSGTTTDSTPTSSSPPESATPAGTITTGPIGFNPGPANALRRPKGSATLTGGPNGVTVTGREIAKVTFYVDGKRVGTVRARRGRTRFVKRLNTRFDRRVHRVTVKVDFAPRSRTRRTTLRLLVRQNPPVPRGPRFTG